MTIELQRMAHKAEKGSNLQMKRLLMWKDL